MTISDFLSQQKKISSSCLGLFKKHDTHFSGTKKIYIMVSGGADSMCLVHFVFYYFFTNGLDMSRLFVLHYNHKYRKESDTEEKHLRSYFARYNFISGVYAGEAKENQRRKERKKFIARVMEEYGTGFVLLGHNIDDCFETSCLHIIRGCKRRGVINMNNNKADSSFSLRPLLSLSKSHIYQECDLHNIPYHEDSSNNDELLSKRNSVRKKINDLFPGYIDRHSHSLDALYKFLVPRWGFFLCQMSPHTARGCSWYNKTRLPSSSGELYEIMSYLGIISGVSQKTIDDIFSFVSGSDSGWKYINGCYILLSHSFLYFVYTGDTRPFWYTSPKDIPTNTTKNSFGLDGNSRYPLSGDIRKGKKLHKRMINKKIPFFWRPFIPVIERNGALVSVLPLGER